MIEKILKRVITEEQRMQDSYDYILQIIDNNALLDEHLKLKASLEGALKTYNWIKEEIYAEIGKPTASSIS